MTRTTRQSAGFNSSGELILKKSSTPLRRTATSSSSVTASAKHAARTATSSSSATSSANPAARVSCPHRECRGKTFDRYGGLTRHINNAHSPEDSEQTRSRVGEFPCPHCEHVATQKTNLAVHIRANHTGEEYPCPHCHYGSPDKGQLLRHVLKYHDDHQFSTRGLLLRGQVADAKAVELKCGFCLYQGKTENQITAHIRSKHTGERLECPDCEWQSASQYAMLRHARMVHNPDISANDLLVVSGHEAKKSKSERVEKPASSETKPAFDTPNLMFMGFGPIPKAKPATAVPVPEQTQATDNFLTDAQIAEFLATPIDPYVEAVTSAIEEHQATDARLTDAQLAEFLALPIGAYDGTVNPAHLSENVGQYDVAGFNAANSYPTTDVSFLDGQDTVTGAEHFDFDSFLADGEFQSGSSGAEFENLFDFNNAGEIQSGSSGAEFENLFDFNNAGASPIAGALDTTADADLANAFDFPEDPDLEMIDFVDPFPDMGFSSEPLQDEPQIPVAPALCDYCLHSSNGRCLAHLHIAI